MESQESNDNTKESKRALDGLRVIENVRSVAGQYCAKLLADMGAEVIKIETPEGDETRNRGPFLKDIPDKEKSGFFVWLNNNKMGITLNIEQPTGREILLRLLEKADVFIEDFNQEEVERLDLDYPVLEKKNPRLVVTSITSFGRSGPYKNYKSYDINTCAAAGISVGIGEADREPLTLPMSLASFQAGGSASSATMVALLAREFTGEGQFVDVSAVDVLATTHHAGGLISLFIYRGIAGTRKGARGGYFNYPNSTLPCKDGHIGLQAPQIEQWKRFIKVIGEPEWTKDPRYRDRRAMAEEYPDEVDTLLIPWFKERTKLEILDVCVKERIPFSPFMNADDIVHSPQLKERDFFVEAEWPDAGTVKLPGAPFKASETPWAIRTKAPSLGQDNQEIICGRLDYSPEDLVKLRRSGTI
jgi:CoA:oxalate CoA-transferase